MFPIVTLFFIGAIVWGYQEHQEKNSILIKAENQYQRAFHDLSYHMEKLHNELGNTLAVSSASQGMHRKGLVNVWRLTSEAQNEINQLPLTLLPFNKTEDLLSRIANFSYKTAVRDLTKEPLSKDEYNTLKTLYKNSGQITKDLQQVQSKVIANNLRWMDVEVAMASENEKLDNTIIDGFRTVDKKVGEYPEINWGPAVSSIYNKRSVKLLSGTPSSPEEIKRKAAEFLGINDPSHIQVTENGAKTEYASYTATAQHQGGGKVQLDYTKKGGKLTSYVNSRTVETKRLSPREAERHAKDFLQSHGYPDMRAVSYDESHSIGNFVFARNRDGVVIYPERVTVRVALDNGEVTGLEASDLVYQKQQKREIKRPKLSLEQARKKLNPEFKEKYNRLALIENDSSDEVLCYEFVGNINGSTYRLYLNGDTGVEEMIEQVKMSNAAHRPAPPAGTQAITK